MRNHCLPLCSGSEGELSYPQSSHKVGPLHMAGNQTIWYQIMDTEILQIVCRVFRTYINLQGHPPLMPQFCILKITYLLQKINIDIFTKNNFLWTKKNSIFFFQYRASVFFFFLVLQPKGLKPKMYMRKGSLHIQKCPGFKLGQTVRTATPYHLGKICSQYRACVNFTKGNQK